MVFLWILILILLGFAAYQFYIFMLLKMSAKQLTSAEFAKEMKNQQLIDVRERDAFNAGHIMGARNFSYFTLKEIGESLRKDRPVFLYAQSRSTEARAANILRKQGYKDIYVLQGGYDQWDGKVKKTK